MMRPKAASPRWLVIAAVAVILFGVYRTHQGVEDWRRHYFADEALWQAVESGDTAAAATAFRRGADPNALGDAGLGERHTLITSQSQRDARMSAFLLSHGASPSYALTVALDAGEAARLLRVGARVNGVTDDFGMTPLGRQAANGRPDIVRLLLVHGANPSTKDKDGETALERARYASGNHPEEAAAYSSVVRLLSAAGTHRGVVPPRR